MNDRFRFKIAVFERYNGRGWEFEGFIEDNNNWHLTTCGDVASNNCYSAHYRRNNAPDNVNRVYEPILSTGLRDKNGTLIYFDDIIKWEDDLYKVIMQTDERNFGRVVAFPIRLLNRKEPWVSECVYLPSIIKESELQGNIYENRELLDESSESF